jgi:ABC-type bacteriocin/lantibiotic exporter with double-glycine peptidase domain
MRSVSASTGPRMFVPEVVQTSAMDCGPAALKSLLEGFGIPVSYPRLQEACQISIDGTSIDTIEQIAIALGLDAEQIMLPADHVLLGAAAALPALIVVRRDNMTHFLVAWRRHGPFIQVMDPAKGRRWLRDDALLTELYLHQQRVPASGWREWAGSPEFLGSVTERLMSLGLRASACERLVSLASTDPGWLGLASLDASTRMVASLVRSGGMKRGREAERVIETLIHRSRAGLDGHAPVPGTYWSVLPDTNADEDQGNEQVVLRGAVLLRVRRRRHSAASSTQDFSPAVADAADGDPATTALRLNLARALNEPASRPLSEIWRIVRRDGLITPTALFAAFLIAAGGVLFEMVLFRGFLEIEQVLTIREHRLVAILLLLALVGSLLLLDIAIAGGVLRLGRRLEARLRAALLEKLPRLGDRYFRSRLVSDMAYRAHALDALRGLPELAARFVGSSTQLVFTAIAIAWLDPPSAWIAALAAVLALAIPLATEQMLAERELRQRSHTAALSRHYLDSLLGLTAARTHSAERALRRRHESLLVEWGRSGLHLLRGTVVIEGLQLLVGSSLAAWLVLEFVSRSARPGGALLLVFWALTLPTLGRETAAAIRRYPAYRNILLRLLEPLGAPDEGATPATSQTDASRAGVALRFTGVRVAAPGRALLEDVELTIEPGEHVAIVGRSGAGKSTLLGVLLGWRQTTAGEILVDGEPLDDERLARLRHATAWVDPGVHLWNRSLFENLRYGADEALVSTIGPVTETAQLGEILEKLPAGLQSPLGEGGGLTSGGEGQRVRFGRALVRENVRLAVLDEPFRGLDQAQRSELLTRARDLWRDATLLCVTHDIAETLSFGRVLVVDEGRIVEDGDPAVLSVQPDSAYAQLLADEHAVEKELWSEAGWRHWQLQAGSITEAPRPTASEVNASWNSQQSSRGR